MRSTRPVALLITATVSTVLAWLLLDTLERGGFDPLPVPWTSSAALVMLALLVVAAAREVRRWAGGRRPRPLSPLTAARIAVLAAASSYVGALLTGWYLAQAVIILPDLVGQRRERFWLALVTALSAALLSGAGLLGQRWCRRPPEADEEQSD